MTLLARRWSPAINRYRCVTFVTPILNASLPAVFRLFRGLGLRYLLVVNDDNLVHLEQCFNLEGHSYEYANYDDYLQIKGIITRKDVARFKERRQRSRYEVNEAYFH
jgi:hypothetical protein